MKKGFTLIELLIIIALFGILALLIVPNVLNTFSSNKTSLSDIQKKQIEEAVKMYVNDHCVNKISSEYDCAFNTIYDNETGIIKVTSGSITLMDFLENGYLDSELIKNNCDETKLIKIKSNGDIDLSEITCNF